MGIHNLIRWAWVVDETFTRLKIDPNAAKLKLPDEHDKITTDKNAPELLQNEWDRLRDYLARQQREYVHM